MSTWETRVAERKSKFLVNASERLQQTLLLIDQLSSNRRDRELLQTIYQNFHKLAGPAGIYSLTHICDHSIAAEDLCARVLQTAEPVSEGELEQLRKYARSILLALNETGSS